MPHTCHTFDTRITRMHTPDIQAEMGPFTFMLHEMVPIFLLFASFYCFYVECWSGLGEDSLKD